MAGRYGTGRGVRCAGRWNEMEDAELRGLLTKIAEGTRRIEDKLARLEVSYIELLAKMDKTVKKV